MKKTEQEKFKKRLQEMREKLSGQLNHASEEVQASDEASGYSQHQADGGTDDFDRTISIELSSKEQELVRQIDRALEKIEEGTYGICDMTEKPIPMKRLEAVPYANMTVEAQEQLEKGLL